MARAATTEAVMSSTGEVHVTVLDPRVEEGTNVRTGLFLLRVTSARALPAAPYAGTVRVGGVEETATGLHPVRLLKHFTVERVEADASPALYSVTVDLSDEWRIPPRDYLPPGCRPRQVADSFETVCKRIAGVFGRYCEQYRPPSVTVRLEP